MTLDLKIVCEDEMFLPKYANDTDACMDLKVKTNGKKVLISPNKTVVLGTGIKVAIPKDYVMFIFPRSSTGFRLHCNFANGVGVNFGGERGDKKCKLALIEGVTQNIFFYKNF